MSLFRRHRSASAEDRPSPTPWAESAAAEGWEPAGEPPLDGHLETTVHEFSLAMYNVTGIAAPLRGVRRIGATAFQDAFRTSVDGRTVIVANAYTHLQSEVNVKSQPVFWAGASVCAAEMPTLLPYASVRPRTADAMPGTAKPTGDPAFDERFLVAGTPEGVGADVGPVLTEQVRQLMMARDDWFFQFERYMLGCIGKGAFQSIDEVRERMGQVLAIVAAIPASVVPDHVDHTEDDLISRIDKLTSLEDAMALLQQLTPDDRERLAHSDTPLSAFADVTTPQEAMARFKDLDQERKMQLIAMFMRVRDGGRDA